MGCMAEQNTTEHLPIKEEVEINEEDTTVTLPLEETVEIEAENTNVSLPIKEEVEIDEEAFIKVNADEEIELPIKLNDVEPLTKEQIDDRINEISAGAPEKLKTRFEASN